MVSLHDETESVNGMNNKITFVFFHFSFSVNTTDVPCLTGMFQCSEGKCIPSLWVCNYQKDCEKGEDEFQSCRKYYSTAFLFSLLVSPPTGIVVCVSLNICLDAIWQFACAFAMVSPLTPENLGEALDERSCITFACT